MAKPRRVSALSSVLKETQEYNKVTQESKQGEITEQEIEIIPPEKHITATEGQEAVNLEKHIAANTEEQEAVNLEKHIIVNTETQKSVNTERGEDINTEIQKSVERGEKLHKQTIAINEHLALRLKIHAARRKETIASIATRAFENLLAEEEEREISQ